MLGIVKNKTLDWRFYSKKKPSGNITVKSLKLYISQLAMYPILKWSCKEKKIEVSRKVSLVLSKTERQNNKKMM